MIRVKQIKLKENEDNEKKLIKKCCEKLKIKKTDIIDYKIVKKSLDARKKPEIFYSYIIDLNVKNEKKLLKNNQSNDVLNIKDETYKVPVQGSVPLKKNPIIIGDGPCGLICAYILAENGYNPIIIERGKKVDERIASVEKFWQEEKLDINSNVQFGEGGAGTFSDGKLNTLVKDNYNRQKKVFNIFVESGAKEEILYMNKPHIGTDLLRPMVKNIREKIINMGGKFYFDTCLTDIKTNNGSISKIELNKSKWIDTDILILAIGHSARDTFKMLLENNINMTSKPFAVGIRIQHPQQLIDKNQYGKISETLKNASYKLTYQTKEKRGVYTFCMCPGGYVVNASSEEKMLAINGMSNYKRDTDNANSAIIVTVNQKDFGEQTLDGVKFQRELESKAYEVGNGKIPIQLYKDFKEGKKTTNIGTIKPILKGNYCFANLNEIFPQYINKSLIEAIEHFNDKINGFNSDDAILAAVESRSSSPVKILRDEKLESNIKGIYPSGEGAGYAGGITSAAIDGIKVAEEIIKKYKPIY